MRTLRTTMINYCEAARLLGVPLGTLYSMVSRRSVPFYRLAPRLVRFDRVELEHWLGSKRVT